jgi:hypothetical protein
MRLFACLVALITGCTDTDPSGITETNVRAYAVTGTDGLVSGPSGQVTQALVDANQNNGVFTVAWNVEAATTTQRIRLLILRDDELDESDAEVLDVICGGPNSLCPGATANALQCQFDTDVTLTCGSGENAQVTDLSTYFAAAAPGLPGDYLLVLQGCDLAELDCQLVGANVRFQ